MYENELQNYQNLFDPFYDFFNYALYETKNAAALRTDIYKEEKGTRFEIDVPGIAKNDIKISLEKGYLDVFFKKERQEGKKPLRSERYYGTFSRKFYVGDRVTKEDISAEVKNGVLSIFVADPKEEKPEVQAIEIR